MSESSPIRLGYVGLGNIGGPMAGSLAAWAGGLTVFDLSTEAVANADTQRFAANNASLSVTLVEGETYVGDTRVVPTTFLIDKDGKVVSRTLGAIDFSKLRQYLDTSLQR